MIRDEEWQRVIALGVALGRLFDELRGTRHAAGMQRVVDAYAKLVDTCIEQQTGKK